MKIVTKGAESKLLDAVNKLKEAPDGYYSLHYHLSQLQENYRSDYQIKIALNILTDLFKGQEGVVFGCKDCDIVVLYKGKDRSLLEKAIFQLRYLFMDDPLGYTENGFENEDFCSVYDLEFQWRDFYNSCRAKALSTSKFSNEDERKIETTHGFRGKMGVLTPAVLESLLLTLERTDISSAFRGQDVCAIVKGKKIKPIFKETYINITHLQQLLFTDIDMLSSHKLFMYFTKALDKRVMLLLQGKKRDFLKPPFSINLNVKSLLTEDFHSFDAAVPRKEKSNVIIELHISDIFEDIHRFMIARDAVQKLGYRILLDGLDSLGFVHINRKELGIDLVKLQWNPDLKTDGTSAENKRIAEAVKQCGPNRVILCHCDNKDAIDYGHSLGISLFQGYYVDKALYPDVELAN